MRKFLTTTAFVLLLASRAAAQSEPSPAPDEAARLNASVVKLFGEGKYEEALPIAKRVLELREKSPGPDDEMLAAALMNLASVHQRLWQLEDAKKLFARALSVYEKANKADAPNAIAARHTVALIEENTGKAIELHERNLALKEKVSGADSMDVSLTLFPLAHRYELMGDYDKALKQLARFVAIRESLKTAPVTDTAVAHYRQACLLRKKGKADEAKQAEARAGEIFGGAAAKLGPVLEGGVINGKALSKPAPSYPVEAKQVRAQGTVTVRVLVGETGTVLSACAQEQGHPSLRRASELAAYSARFTPTSVNGKPVKVTGVITYNFVLQ